MLILTKSYLYSKRWSSIKSSYS